MKILIVYHSQTAGNTEKMAQAVAKGAREQIASAGGNSEVILKAVEAAKPQDCVEADAIVLGSSNRFGLMSAPMKEFVEKLAAPNIFFAGKLIGKVGAAFCTSGTLHCGKEMTLLSLLLPMLHHGMYLVGVPEIEARTAGSCYGATATTGKGGANPPTEADLEVAENLGRRVAEFTARVCARGRPVKRTIIEHPGCIKLHSDQSFIRVNGG